MAPPSARTRRLFAGVMRAWMPPPVSATELAPMLGVSDTTVRDWAARGLIPSIVHGKQLRFSTRAVRKALEAHSWSGGTLYTPNSQRSRMVQARRAEEGSPTRACSKCGRDLPLSSYPPSSVRIGGWNCRACRTPAKRANDIRRRRAKAATQVDVVDINVVAQRDGWCCGICGKRVTRATWSLDHIVPLSKGGGHTYENVVLAHLACNVKRGAGRLPVQAPLFALLPAPPRTP